MDRLLSRNLQWTVQAFLNTSTITLLNADSTTKVFYRKRNIEHRDTAQVQHREDQNELTAIHPSHSDMDRAEHSLFIVHRRHIKALIKQKKSLRNQAVIEAALWEGLRTTEISSLRAEWLDFENGVLWVLDSKKKRMFPIPLNSIWALHTFTYMELVCYAKAFFLILRLAHEWRREGK